MNAVESMTVSRSARTLRDLIPVTAKTCSPSMKMGQRVKVRLKLCILIAEGKVIGVV